MPIPNLNNLPMGQPEANQSIQPKMPISGQQMGLPSQEPNLELQEALSGDAKMDLKRKMSDIENKEGAYQAERYVAQNKIKELKMAILKKIFNAMLGMGIDPGNRESVGKFLQELEKQDPDLVIMFESALDSLSSDFENRQKPGLGQGMEPITETEGVVAEEPVIPPEGLMSKYSDLQQGLLRK